MPAEGGSTGIPPSQGQAAYGRACGISNGNDALLATNIHYNLDPSTLVPDFILPAALTTIEDEAFIGGAFIYVKLPDKAVSIGWHAFADCPNLMYIYIPAQTTEIDEEAFGTMQNLTIFGETGSNLDLSRKVQSGNAQSLELDEI